MKRSKLFLSLSVLYFFASFINLYFALKDISIYKSWSDSALIPFYKYFMTNISLTALKIIMIFIFMYQLFMSLCFFIGKDMFLLLGLLCAIAFHTIIIPWGLWSTPNILFVGLYSFLLYKNFKDTIYSFINKLKNK